MNLNLSEVVFLVPMNVCLSLCVWMLVRQHAVSFETASKDKHRDGLKDLFKSPKADRQGRGQGTLLSDL